jgi:SAM-dependent methyltransferase
VRGFRHRRATVARRGQDGVERYPMTPEDDAARLEGLWSGDFGDDYVERNRAASEGRRPFWEHVLGSLEVESALEIGCNVGGNLRWLAELLTPDVVAGVDVNERALEVVRSEIPGVDVRVASARELPFATTASTSCSPPAC